MLSFRNKQPAAAGASGASSSGESSAVAGSTDSNDSSSGARRAHGKKMPSKVERRNQDAMEILQQLHLDEEDYGFGFPLLHHHSFVLGDLNYRMTRQFVLPTQMLDLLAQVGMSTSTTATTRTSSCASSRTASARGERHGPPDIYQEVTTPSMLRHLPDIPAAIGALIREHDELAMLRESSQLFYGFAEPPISFFPTFRRIRGERLLAFDAESLSRNYSLMASGGSLRVPSYTDRIMHASLPGRSQQVQCLYYDSCESVTSSDHKPVCAVFRVGSMLDEEVEAMDAKPVAQRMMPRMPSLFGSAPTLRRKNSAESACDVVLKVEFRSIRWMDAVDVGVGNLFSRLENIEVGFLFPLPCEDVLSQQRKLQQVAAHLNWGESIDMSTPLPVSGSPTGAATNAASPNFHVTAWNKFVEQGLRYQTRVVPTGKKHVALTIRTRSRPIHRTNSGSRSRSRAGSASGNGIVSATSLNSTGVLSRRSSVNSSFTSSSSYELTLGHGAFCIEKTGKRQDTIVPLTMGGNLVGRLHLRVTLQMRPQS